MKPDCPALVPPLPTQPAGMLRAQVSVSGYPFGNLGYTSADNACTGVIIGFDLQIVTGVAFASNNLQQKASTALEGRYCPVLSPL